MRYIILIIIYSLISALGNAQSLTISESASTKNNSSSQFLVAGHQVSLDNTSLAFTPGAESSGINSLTALSVALDESGVMLYEGNGKKLRTSSYNIMEKDESVKVYAMPDGGFVIRENDVNFLFFDAFGNVKQSISNASQSREGEATSELASDPAFKTVVLYNPKVIMNGAEGSRANIVKSNRITSGIFYSQDRAIRLVQISDNGQFIGIATYAPGSEDQVVILDRFGNELSVLDFNQAVSGLYISGSGKFVTVWSNGRAVAYSISGEEWSRGASFRSRLHFAKYISEDDLILALTADEANGTLTEVEIHAVDLAKSAIYRENYSEKLAFSQLLPVKLIRTNIYSYSLTGLNKTLDLKVDF